MDDEVKNLKVQTRRKEKIHKNKTNWNWIIQITVIAFTISFLFSPLYTFHFIISNKNAMLGTI